MTSINFDYFVERGTILTEMARTASLPWVENPPSELLNAYQKLRTYTKSHYGITNSSSIDLFVFRCIYYLIEEYLTSDEQSEWESIPKMQTPVKNMASRFLNKVIHTNPQSIPKIVEGLTNPEKIEELKSRMTQTVKHQNRSEGKEKEFESLTGMSRDEFRQLTTKVEPLIKQMNKLMGNKKTSIARVGDKSKFLQKSPEESVTPNVRSGIDIVTVLSEVSAFRQKLRESGELEDKSEVSMWAAKDPAGKLKQVMKSIPDNMFDAYIGNLMTTIEQKIESGIGQSIDGFLKLVNVIKGQPKIPKSVIELFDIIVEKLQSNTVEDIYQSKDDENKFEGYDEDVVNKVLETPEQRDMVEEWLRASRKEREALDATLNRKYEDKVSNLMSQIKGENITKSSGPRRTQEAAIANFKRSIENKENMGADTSKDRVTLSKMLKRLDYIKNAELELGKVKTAPKNPWNKKISDIEQKIQFIQEELSSEDDPSRQKELKQSIARLNAELEMAYLKASEWQPVQESVLSYMTEQISKDNKFGKSPTQFKDRGFKKFQNYNQWLTFND